MRREIFIAAAMLLAFVVIFGYGFYPDSTAQMAIDTGAMPDSIPVLAEGASIWTDKPDYEPGEIVTIFGSGFNLDSVINISITRPDMSIDKGNTTSDSAGNFVYYYDLDGIDGLYEVIATDGVNSAPTTFTDVGSLYWLGYKIDYQTGGTWEDGVWMNGDLSPHEDYVECDWVPYQLIIDSDSPVWDDSVTGFIAGGSMYIGWTFWSSNYDSIYTDMLGSFYYKFDTSPLSDGDPGSQTPFDLGFSESTHPTWSNFTPELLNRPGTASNGQYTEVPESCDNPINDHFIKITPGVGGFPDSTDFSSGHTGIVLYFQAHLALDALWRNGQEAVLPTDVAGTLYSLGSDGLPATGDEWTCPHHGSSYFQGSASHFFLQHPESKGKKTIPIPVASYPEGIIDGHKLEDLNGNGEIDGSDQGIQDWGIDGYASVEFMPGMSFNFYLGHVDTDVNGYFAYTGIIEGVYTIDEEEKDGWSHTGAFVNSGPASYDPIEGSVTLEILTAGESAHVDFLNTRYGKISGYKWNDLNGDGFWDIGEPALDGWTIELRNATTNAIIATAITGAGDYDDGYYNFTNVLPGNYLLTEVLMTGWTNTASPSAFTLSPGDDLNDKNFGNFKNVDITVRKMNDLYGDGTSLSAIEGWEIYLYKDDVLFDTKTTNSTGCYTWTDLGPGSYMVIEETPDGWTALTDTSHDFGVVTSGHATYEFVFRNFEWLKIWGYKYLDYNGELPDDIRLGGWTIELYRHGGSLTLYDSVVTGTGSSWPLGYYEFIVKDPGIYDIMEVLKNGWDQTSPCHEESPEDGSTPSVLGYPAITVSSGIDIPNMDFWNRLVMTWITDTSENRNPVTDFRIVFTPDITPEGFFFKISATNPGQFYMNILYHAGTSSQVVNFSMPDGWAVKDLGNPIHAYVWNDNGPLGDGDGEIDYWIELTDITHKITVVGDKIYVDGVEICNDILITIHLEYTEKGKGGIEFGEIAGYDGREYTFGAEVDDYLSETTLTAHAKQKQIKASACYGVALDTTLYDTPITGITFSIYNSKGHCVDSYTTDEYGFYVFDNLKPDTYILEIEIPLQVLVEGLEDSNLVLRITMEIKMNKADYIQVSIFIEGDSTTVVGPPGLVLSQEIGPPSSPSSSSSNTRDFFHPGKDVEGNENIYQSEASISSFNLGIPILAIWFATVSIFAYVFDSRRRKKPARSTSEVVSSKSSLEWLLEDSDS